MSILQNAIDSIAIGLEDFNSPDSRRLISSTRNIFAGVLLLFKYKLSLLSPEDSDEVLIKQRITPQMDSNDILRWVGKGKKTVDVSQIQERFKALDIIVDWSRLNRINSYRNDIEHYFSSQSKSSIETLISSSFIIIQSFITDYLEEDPQELLGKESWNILIKISEVYSKERSECIERLQLFQWESDTLSSAIENVKCLACGSDLITVNENNDFECRSCSEVYLYDSIIKNSLEQYCTNYDFQEGGDAELITCPFCNEETYMFHEQKCALCNESASHECSRCNTSIPSCEITDESLCSYCSYMSEKLKYQ